MLISSSKTVLGGEASTSTPVNVEPIGSAEPLTTGEASVTSHRGNISPKLESLKFDVSSSPLVSGWQSRDYSHSHVM